MQREVKKKSALPIYAFAAVCLVYSLFFPLYKFWHFFLLTCIATLVEQLVAKFTTKTILETIPERVDTGDAELDAIIAEGKLAMAEMRRLKVEIDNQALWGKIDEIIDVSEKIINNVQHTPASSPQVKKFLHYYLPTTIKLLHAYDRMYAQGITGENITSSLTQIETMLDTCVDAYKKQLDALFANQAMDIETDIKVMDSMLRREGFGPDAFTQLKQKGVEKP